MSFWQIFGESAVSDQGETIQRLGLTLACQFTVLSATSLKVLLLNFKFWKNSPAGVVYESLAFPQIITDTLSHGLVLI